jgi:hypothetical protein
MGLPEWDTVRLTIEGIDGLEGTAAGTALESLNNDLKYFHVPETALYCITTSLLSLPHRKFFFYCLQMYTLTVTLSA